MSGGYHRPRKRFGQNFLHDAGVVARIVSAIDPRPADLMVEIGPGHGALTRPLLDVVDHLHVIELDRDLAARLERDISADRLRVFQADALRFDFRTLATTSERLRVVGNLPYNVSSPLLFHLLSYADVLQDMHFMLQKEVVDRMTCAPGSRVYGRLSVMIQAQCQAQSLFSVGPGAFNPAPKVDSAVVRLIPQTHPLSPRQLSGLSAVTTQAFAQRRKTLRNALKGLADSALLESLGVDPGARPETLGWQTFLRIANAIEPSLSGCG